MKNKFDIIHKASDKHLVGERLSRLHMDGTSSSNVCQERLTMAIITSWKTRLKKLITVTTKPACNERNELELLTLHSILRPKARVNFVKKPTYRYRMVSSFTFHKQGKLVTELTTSDFMQNVILQLKRWVILQFIHHFKHARRLRERRINDRLRRQHF